MEYLAVLSLFTGQLAALLLLMRGRRAQPAAGLARVAARERRLRPPLD